MDELPGAESKCKQMNHGIAQPALERCLWNPGVTSCVGLGTTSSQQTCNMRTVKYRHAVFRLQAVRM
jgi:hypothetical protein